MLWMVQRVAFGVPAERTKPLLFDLNVREMVTLVPLALLVFWIGVYPGPIVTAMHQTVNKLVQRLAYEGLGARGEGHENERAFASGQELRGASMLSEAP